MKKQLSSIVRLRTLIVSMSLSVVGLCFLLIDGQLALEGGLVSEIPWNELGNTLLVAGMLSVWVDFLLRREQDALAEFRLAEILRQHAPAMRDAVLEAFAANRDDLARVATPDTLDRIISNSLALRLDDEQFAREVFEDIRDQAVQAPERWHNLELDISLSAMDSHPDYFVVTVRREYETVPSFSQRTFVCTSDRREYAELSAGNTETRAWYLRPNDHFRASDRAAYELVQFTVNGEDRPIRRSSRQHYQAYTVHLVPDATATSEPVVISQTFRTVARRSGNLLFFDVEQPTRNVAVSLDYTATDIGTISAIDHTPSVRPVRVERSSGDIPTKSIRLELDGWVFPRAGIAFVWSLDNSSAAQRSMRPGARAK